jgi:hypothetical protein
VAREEHDSVTQVPFDQGSSCTSDLVVQTLAVTDAKAVLERVGTRAPGGADVDAHGRGHARLMLSGEAPAPPDRNGTNVFIDVRRRATGTSGRRPNVVQRTIRCGPGRRPGGAHRGYSTAVRTEFCVTGRARR